MMLLRTRNSASLLVARLAAGLVILPHGAQKALGMFGGAGISGTLDFFQSNLGIPAAATILAIAAEFLGGLGLVFGFLARLSALGVGAVMVVAVVKVHGDHGFFMNWYGTAGKGQGYEYHILMIGLCLAVLIGGAGALSVDRSLSKGEDE